MNCKTGVKGQIWLPESIGNGSYRIRSAYIPTLTVAIHKESIAEEAGLVVVNEQDRSVLWKIQGALP